MHDARHVTQHLLGERRRDSDGTGTSEEDFLKYCCSHVILLSTMDRAGKKSLKANEDTLFSCVDPAEFRDYLIQEDVLTESQREVMMADVTRRGRTTKFIGYLKTQRNGFDKLLRILDHKQMNWVKEPLERERNRLIESGENYAVLDRCNPNKIKIKLSDRQSFELAKCLGARWKELAYELDLGSEVYIIEAENRENPTMVGMGLLNKWGQRRLDEANLSILLPILDEMGVDYDEQKVIRLFS